mmetsp:Transcript_23458/g.39791  ORF Transcript_23458/g.39791 Transcript_23458/m.39791 type:complete len:1007 (-) Transcript_23458:1316-4336(-)
MKRSGSKEPAALKDKLLRSIQFLEAQVKAVGKIQQHFVSFTDRSLKEILIESEKYAGSPRISILWHDFVFIFFQYFIAIYDEFMALCTGDLMTKRLRHEHKEFQHHRENNVQASTNATTYAGSWFTMACFDGINLEARQAEKLLKRREYEALELQLLHVESLSDTLERSKSLFLDTLKQVTASMREVRGAATSGIASSSLLFSKVDYSKGHMCENMTFTLNSTGEVHFYSRRTMADTNITSKLSGHHPLKVILDKSRLLSDPFASPAWFPMSLYTRLVAKQKRTILDDDDDEEEGEAYSPDAKKRRGVVVKKRSMAEIQKDIAGDDATIANTGNGGVSLDAIKKQYNANSTLLAEEETSARVSSHLFQSQSLTTTNPNFSQSVGDVPVSGGGGCVVSDIGGGQSSKRSRLGLPAHTGASAVNSSLSGGAGHATSSLRTSQSLGSHHNNLAMDLVGTTLGVSAAQGEATSMQTAWKKANEDRGDDSADIAFNKLTHDASINGVVVVFEEVAGEEGPSNEIISASEGEDTSRLCSGLVPRACAISINLSWVDMCSPASGTISNGVMISTRNLLKHALRQLWCARLEKSDKSESFYQLPVTVNVEKASSSGAEKITQVYHDGDLIPLSSLMENSFSIWCASEMSIVSVLRLFGQQWASLRLTERAARGGTGRSIPLKRQRRCPRPSFSLLTQLRNYYISITEASSSATTTPTPVVHLMLNNLVISYKELFHYVDIILAAVKTLTGKPPRIQLQYMQFPVTEEGDDSLNTPYDSYGGSTIILSLLNKCESLHISNCFFPDILHLFSRTAKLLYPVRIGVDGPAMDTVDVNAASGVAEPPVVCHDLDKQECAADDVIDGRHSLDSPPDGPQPSKTMDMHCSNALRRPLSELVISYVDVTRKSTSDTSSSVSLLLSILLSSALDTVKGDCGLKIELRRCVPNSGRWTWPPLVNGQMNDPPIDDLHTLKQGLLRECSRLVGDKVLAQKSVNKSGEVRSEDELLQTCCNCLFIH